MMDFGNVKCCNSIGGFVLVLSGSWCSPLEAHRNLTVTQGRLEQAFDADMWCVMLPTPSSPERLQAILQVKMIGEPCARFDLITYESYYLKMCFDTDWAGFAKRLRRARGRCKRGRSDQDSTRLQYSYKPRSAK